MILRRPTRRPTVRVKGSTHLPGKRINRDPHFQPDTRGHRATWKEGVYAKIETPRVPISRIPQETSQTTFVGAASDRSERETGRRAPGRCPRIWIHELASAEGANRRTSGQEDCQSRDAVPSCSRHRPKHRFLSRRTGI